MNGWAFLAILVVALVAESIACKIHSAIRMKCLTALTIKEAEEKEKEKS